MKKIILTENEKLEILGLHRSLITESLDILGTKVSIVPINWKDPKIGKYSGQLKIEHGGSVTYYKLKVDTFAYDGPVLIKKFWKSGKGYTVIDSTGKDFPISEQQMNSIVTQAKKDLATFTIKSSLADLTLTKTV